MKPRRHSSLLPVIASLLVLAVCPAASAGDCNANGAEDLDDLMAGTSLDCNLDGVPDECPLPDVPHLFGGPVSLTEFLFRKTTADMDGDGDLDIVTFYVEYYRNEGRVPGTESIVVLLNRGDGEIAREERHVLGVPLDDHYEADIDGDGDIDTLALLEEVKNGVSPRSLRVLLNRGDGVLVAGSSDLPVPGTAYRPSLADVDGDGDLDFVSTDFGAYTTAGHGDDAIGTDLVVVYNQGNGSFDGARQFPAGDSPDRHVTADMDGDGDLDVIVPNTGDAREGEGPTVDTISVLRNQGDGMFEAPVPHALGHPATRLAAADIDRDGDTDVLASSWAHSGFTVLHGDGRGGFEAIVHHPLAEGTSPDLVRLEDLDGDGDLDLATSRADYSGLNAVSVHLNDGSGGFGEPQAFAYQGRAYPMQFIIDDLDGDGDLDIAAALYQADKVALHLNDGNGVFSEAIYVPVEDPKVLASNPHITAADMDGDGAVDLIAGAVIVFGGGSRAAAGANEGCREFLRGDFNADGQVSLSDAIAVRRWLFSGKGGPPCMDAGDANDDEILSLADMVGIIQPVLAEPDWPDLLPAPSTSAGSDPTYLGGDPEARPMGCREYEVAPPGQGNVSITFGAVSAGPGEEVVIPVLLTSDVPVEGFQLVMEHDPARLGVVSGKSGLSFEDTHYETGFPGRSEDGPLPQFRALTVHPEAGVFTVAVIGHFIEEGFEVPPGTDVPVARIHAIIPAAAEPGTILSIAPAAGAGAGGVGPYRLRNEVTVQSEARFASATSSVGIARVNIVGDQAFFRGEVNGDQRVDIADPVFILGYLFQGGPRPSCLDAADTDDTGELNVTDGVYLLRHLFQGTEAPPAPYPDPGPDPTADGLDC